MSDERISPYIRRVLERINSQPPQKILPFPRRALSDANGRFKHSLELHTAMLEVNGKYDDLGQLRDVCRGVIAEIDKILGGSN